MGYTRQHEVQAVYLFAPRMWLMFVEIKVVGMPLGTSDYSSYKSDLNALHMPLVGVIIDPRWHLFAL
jgi:hypothetical protein